MTKNERLQQLQNEDKLYKALDKIYFDPAWREYVKDCFAKNKISNDRLYKIFVAIKGQEFADDVMGLMKDIKLHQQRLQLTKKPEGIKLEDSRYTTIKEIWIDQRAGSMYHEDVAKGYRGSFYIQLKTDRWIKVDYAQ